VDVTASLRCDTIEFENLDLVIQLFCERVARYLEHEMRLRQFAGKGRFTSGRDVGQQDAKRYRPVSVTRLRRIDRGVGVDSVD